MGGNGIAIGSLGQYLEDSSVENVVVDNVKIQRYNEDMHNSAYIKTWIGEPAPQEGYESAGAPRGGGWGEVRNILFSNFEIAGANSGPAITQGNGDNGSFAGTSNMLVSTVVKDGTICVADISGDIQYCFREFHRMAQHHWLEYEPSFIYFVFEATSLLQY